MRKSLLHFIFLSLQLLGVCATFPTETVTPAKQFYGPIIVAWTGITAGWRVVDASVKIGNEWHKIMGGNIEQIVEMFKKATGIEIDLTCDELSDWDASTDSGKQASVTLKQLSATDSTKMGLLTIPTAVVETTDIGFKRSGEVTTRKAHITAYNSSIGTLYTWDPAATAA